MTGSTTAGANAATRAGLTPIATMDQLPARLAWFAEMRRTTPVLFDDVSGSWHVFRYDDVSRLLTDHATFSSAVFAEIVGPGEDIQGLGASMVMTDPPYHHQLRSLVSRAFTPKAVNHLGPRIAAIGAELLDAMMSRAPLDLIRDFAYPLPIAVIGEMLGVSLERRADFKRWSDAIVSGHLDASAEAEPRFDAATREMTAYFREVIAERTHRPGDDLISGLLQAEIDGRRLTETELIGFCQLLLVAGNETTMNLIANTVLCLDDHPDAMAKLRRSPELMPSAIEEVLRFLPPILWPAPRRAVTDVELSGQRIPRGDLVLPWVVSANRDERQFSDPDRFDIERTPNKHRTFGHGIHVCLGAPLARLEAAIALPMLLERLPGLRVVRDEPIPIVDSGAVFGPRVLPVAFDRS